MTQTRNAGPLYLQVKDFLREGLVSEKWKPGDRVPSENELVRMLEVSRMTVNRAVRELSDEGLLDRIPGVGTFVAESRAQGHLLEVHNIADEIRQRGHRHSAKVLRLEEVPAPPEVARGLHLSTDDSVFHSQIVHLENDHPIQFEDRYVHVDVAPDYLRVDFETTTPSEHLTEVAPLKKVEHVVRAVVPGEEIRLGLEMAPGDPCLLLLRRTWSGDRVASTARLYHPGPSYQLGDRFSAH